MAVLESFVYGDPEVAGVRKFLSLDEVTPALMAKSGLDRLFVETRNAPLYVRLLCFDSCIKGIV
ncbi:hypothetical protein [Mesorhizobium humile]|uniref:Uncharacterized protein n=1 Tax=Mesorhizobium humile TaxID=3072313 RepID=A0ABU4YM62_9HYPH|nr:MULTISPECIES: hypothetical protein [unclassified Mesorhizobium]MDX8457858.1 hypothetical protein [Mesorhizobium sp. VK2D]MDX8487938.1 hypothetical protein [Mesorhizobium sp. VK2B]